ncbi:MAG: hypothetical protein KDC87_13130 [Planctomycetes bacterium]|nr:hypothetical protein [Planctomycetota bacterium]MCB9871996.1 hypothetical protein [Planctomycetota bacterium]MCB9888401.1 hypothetical protein [Planctomycetota bacterium]
MMRGPTRSLWRALCLASAWPLLGACHWASTDTPIPVNHYFADARDLQTVRRVMLLPLLVGDGVRVDERMVRRSLTRELNLLQRFQVVALPEGKAEEAAVNHALDRGQVSTSALVQLARQYRLDGVIVGRISSYRPYLPPHLGIEARLFSLHTGSWVWVADATFDTNTAACMSDLRHYAATALPSADLTPDSVRLIRLSPQRFASYACHRLVGTWRR